MLWRIPPCIVFLENSFNTNIMRLDGERASAICIESCMIFFLGRRITYFCCIVGFSPFFIHDGPCSPFKMKNWIYTGQHKINGMIINFNDFNVFADTCQKIGSIRTNTSGREYNIISSEIVAIMKFYTLAQMKAPASWFYNFPACSKCRLNIEIRAATNQPFIHITQSSQCKGLVECIWIQGFQGTLKCKFQCFGRS